MSSHLGQFIVDPCNNVVFMFQKPSINASSGGYDNSEVTPLVPTSKDKGTIFNISPPSLLYTELLTLPLPLLHVCSCMIVVVLTKSLNSKF